MHILHVEFAIEIRKSHMFADECVPVILCDSNRVEHVNVMRNVIILTAVLLFACNITAALVYTLLRIDAKTLRCNEIIS